MIKRALFAAILCISIQYAVPNSALAAEPPCGKDIQIGDDDTRYYCLSRRVIEDCKGQQGATDLDKCIQIGCVRGAGTKLQKQRLSCIGKNESCLQENGEIASLTTAITACLVGLATPAPGASCFLGALGGGAEHDYAVNVCKSRFGDCMEQPLDEHKNQIKFCSSKPRIQ
jgi:hypothetical protein